MLLVFRNEKSEMARGTSGEGKAGKLFLGQPATQEIHRQKDYEEFWEEFRDNPGKHQE